MPQLNEKIKLRDLKRFFPSCQQVLASYGIESEVHEDQTLCLVCREHCIDIDRMMVDLARVDCGRNLKKSA